MENTSIEIFKYEVAQGVSEYHAILRVTQSRLTYTAQVDSCSGQDFQHYTE